MRGRVPRLVGVERKSCDSVLDREVKDPHSSEMMVMRCSKRRGEGI